MYIILYVFCIYLYIMFYILLFVTIIIIWNILATLNIELTKGKEEKIAKPNKQYKAKWRNKQKSTTNQNTIEDGMLTIFPET